MTVTRPGIENGSATVQNRTGCEITASGRVTPEGGSLEQAPCPICGLSDEKFLFFAFDKMFSWRQEKFPVVRCRHCGLVYLNPRPSRQTRNLYYEGYPCRADRMDQSQPLAHYQPVIDFLARRSPGRILDIGTGNSPFLPAMKERGWETFGTEIDAGLVDYYRSRYGIEIFEGELEDAKLSSESFDAVTIMGVLEHVPYPRLLLEEAGRILKPGGVIILWCFNRGAEADLLGRYWLGFDTPRHFYSFSSKTLGRLLAVSGFEVTDSYYRPISYLAHSGVWAARRFRDRLLGREPAAWVPNLPAFLQKMSLPLGWVLARRESGSNVYLFARKAGRAPAAK